MNCEQWQVVTRTSTVIGNSVQVPGPGTKLRRLSFEIRRKQTRSQKRIKGQTHMFEKFNFRVSEVARLLQSSESILAPTELNWKYFNLSHQRTARDGIAGELIPMSKEFKMVGFMSFAIGMWRSTSGFMPLHLLISFENADPGTGSIVQFDFWFDFSRASSRLTVFLAMLRCLLRSRSSRIAQDVSLRCDFVCLHTSNKHFDSLLRLGYLSHQRRWWISSTRQFKSVRFSAPSQSLNKFL